jgi:hypothetical protein
MFDRRHSHDEIIFVDGERDEYGVANKHKVNRRTAQRLGWRVDGTSDASAGLPTRAATTKAAHAGTTTSPDLHDQVTKHGCLLTGQRYDR